MSGTGRPLRFLGLVIGGWVTLRLVAVTMPQFWGATPAPNGKVMVATRAMPAPVIGQQLAKAGPSFPQPLSPAPRLMPSVVPRVPDVPPMPSRPVDDLKQPRLSGASMPASSAASATETRPPPSGSPPVAQAVAWPASIGGSSGSRWSLTGWLLWRPESTTSLAQAPLLGGSQGGVRLDYHLWQVGDRNLNIYGRFTRALEQPFADEGAVGFALRPIKGLPVSLLAERRQRLGAGGRSGFALLAAGGIGPKPVAPRLEIEGYAQAGVVGLPGSDGFADGRVSLDYKLASKPDLGLGVVVSGAAQTGVSRLDIGPELRLRLPVAGGHIRLSAEWRQRIAGDARPASGPAITLVTDF